MDRLDQLLEMAGQNSLRGCDPLNQQFLVENNVTSDECFKLSKMIGNAIVGYARSNFNSRVVDDIKAAFDDPEERAEALQMLKYATNEMRMREVTARLAETNKETVSAEQNSDKT
jgi:hypothetical protein